MRTEYGDLLSVFSPNTGKYGPEKTPYLDSFHAVLITKKEKLVGQYLSKTLSSLAEVTEKTEVILKILHRKSNFPSRNYLANVNKSTIFCGFFHVY